MTRVLIMAAANGVSVLLLGTLCLLRFTGRVGVVAFVACLIVLFVLVTALWLSAERRHRNLPLFRRLGCIVIGLAIAIAGAPMLVLTPLFWLDAQLPTEAQFQQLVVGPTMASILVALALAVLVNMAGGSFIALRALLGGRARTVAGPGVR